MQTSHYSSSLQPAWSSQHDTAIYTMSPVVHVQRPGPTFPPRPSSCRAFLMAATRLSIMSEGAITWQPTNTLQQYVISYTHTPSAIQLHVQCHELILGTLSVPALAYATDTSARREMLAALLIVPSALRIPAQRCNAKKLGV